MDEFPYEITDLDSAKAKELMNLFTGELTGYVRVGPKGYLFPHKYKEEASDIYNLPLRPTDIFVSSYPRSGTTLTQELVWMIANNLNYERSNTTRLTKRYCFLDFNTLYHPKILEGIKTRLGDNKEKLELFETFIQPGVIKLANMPSPRFVKSHFPLSLLPPTLLDTAKVVYVARDPRDVAVSFYHHNKCSLSKGYKGDFKTYWNYFTKDLLIKTPLFEHIKEAWDKRHHPNMLFLFYEDLVQDMPTCIHRTAKFFNKDITNEQVIRLCDHLRFDNFKNNKNVCEDIRQIPELVIQGGASFIRRGKVGGWRDYFDLEMTQQAERWIAEKLLDTDLRFPDIKSE